MGYRIFGLGYIYMYIYTHTHTHIYIYIYIYIYEILMCRINSQEAYRINLGIKSA
jgi:hypothetical protein